MRSFDEIFAIAAERHGGADELAAKLTPPKAAEELAATPDDRWLAAMARGVFQAGFSWKVIEAKWPGFETAFKGFDVGACAMMDADWFDALVADTAIVRHAAKIRSVQTNAVFLGDFARSHGGGGAGAAVANWPSDDNLGLRALLEPQGARLGGTTGQYMLRFMGKDSFILSRDVVGRLIAEGVVDKPPTSKGAMAAVQGAFNEWSAQSGRSLTEISRVLALSL
ncbi:MAG: DNA-3-methyladenine glycosylase I [Pseudomonadota bacterium]